MNEHEKFIELCALYTSGTLSDEQVQLLDQHLVVCTECRKALHEFQAIESTGFQVLGPDFSTDLELETHSSEMDHTTQRLLAKIKNTIQQSPVGLKGASISKIDRRHSQMRLWKETARTILPYAAAIVITFLFSFFSYRLGVRGVKNESDKKREYVKSTIASLRSHLVELNKDRESTSSQLQASSRMIESLTKKIKAQMSEIESLKNAEKNFAETAHENEQKSLASDEERERLSQKLEVAEASLMTVQKELASVREEHSSEVIHDASLQRKMEELSVALKDQEELVHQQAESIDNQTRLLSYDRDIRNLIGARDLYVAEVADVGRNGQTQKPFGRVFYTKGKSLIFYAYDLDQQPEVRNASTFEAWGRRGADFSQALPLGIFYLDSSSNRRWVLKFDNPKALAEIDAVFVTVEPNGASRKPSGKPLLFAYLKVEPNHP